jgi:RimK-like ATP-grasp domain
VIVLWGLLSDNPLRRVGEELKRLGTVVRELDQGNPLATRIVLEVGTGVAGRIEAADWTLDLAEVTALYARPYEWNEICAELGFGRTSPEERHIRTVQEIINVWWSVMPGIVVNHPDAMASNGSKPFQLKLIQDAGMEVPDTLVTTDPKAVLEFWERHRSVVYKSVSSVRSKVAPLTASSLARLADVTACPTQFQEYVPGTDVRVHVVGDEVFATEIISSAVDYRYATADSPGEPDLRAMSLPDDIGSRCVALANALGLLMAGIDLRRTPGGRWYCLEVNPSPGFTYYESATAQPIAAATARLLAGRHVGELPAEPAPRGARPESNAVRKGAGAQPFIRSHERPEVGRGALRNIPRPQGAVSGRIT